MGLRCSNSLLAPICVAVALTLPVAAQAQAARARRFTEAHNWPGERARYLDLVDRLTGAQCY